MLVAEKEINESFSELHLTASLLLHGNKQNADSKREEFSSIIREAKGIFNKPDSVNRNSSRLAIELAFSMHFSDELKRIVKGFKTNERVTDKAVEKILNELESL